MPYLPMSQLQIPPNDCPVWRYMDMWKFESVIKTLSLFFLRSDRFDDPRDSVLPQSWLAAMQRPMVDRPDGGQYTYAEWYEEREIPTNPIQCWNCDSQENARMWSEYTTSPESLVVRSTVESFADSFAATSKNVLIGRIEYCDHDTLPSPIFATSHWNEPEQPPTGNPWYFPRWCKQPNFSYENELRATIHLEPDELPIEKGFSLAIGKEGVGNLIQAVHLHPNAPGGFGDRVNSMLNEHGFDRITVAPSELPEL